MVVRFLMSFPRRHGRLVGKCFAQQMYIPSWRGLESMTIWSTVRLALHNTTAWRGLDLDYMVLHTGGCVVEPTAIWSTVRLTIHNTTAWRGLDLDYMVLHTGGCVVEPTAIWSTVRLTIHKTTAWRGLDLDYMVITHGWVRG